MSSDMPRPCSFRSSKHGSLPFSRTTHNNKSVQITLGIIQGQIDGFFSQLPFKCYLPEVASVGDSLQICPWVASRAAHMLHLSSGCRRMATSCGWCLATSLTLRASPRTLAWPRSFLSQTVSKVRSQLVHKSVNLSLTITNIQNKLTLCGNGLLSNDFKNNFADLARLAGDAGVAKVLYYRKRGLY